MTTQGDALVVYEQGFLAPPAATVAVLGVDLLFVAAIGVALQQRRRSLAAARAAELAVVPGAPLFEGQRFLEGTVELAEGAPFAVRVTVSQAGTTRAVKNGHVHDWIEIDRTTEAAPFYVRLESGTRVRVEPPARPSEILLVDALDQKEHVELERRKRRAELTPGERVVVEGRLGRARDPESAGAQSYRDPGQGWVMRPMRDGSMRFSSEDLARRHRLRARALYVTAVFVAFGWLAAQGTLAGYRLRQVAGRDVAAEYRGKRNYTTYNQKNRRVQHYVVDYVETDAAGLETVTSAEIAGPDYWNVPKAAPAVMVRRVAAARWATALGRGAGVHGAMLVVPLFIAALAWLRLGMTLVYKRWYEQRLDERNKHGVLPLPDGSLFRAATAPVPSRPPLGASPKAAPVR